MQGRHKSAFSSKAILFHIKPYDLLPNFLTHTALAPRSQVPKGMHNFLPSSTLATRSEQPLSPLSHSLLVCEMGTQCLPSNVMIKHMREQAGLIRFMASVSCLLLSLAPDLNTPRSSSARWFCRRLPLHGLWLPHS